MFIFIPQKYTLLLPTIVDDYMTLTGRHSLYCAIYRCYPAAQIACFCKYILAIEPIIGYESLSFNNHLLSLTPCYSRFEMSLLNRSGAIRLVYITAILFITSLSISILLYQKKFSGIQYKDNSTTIVANSTLNSTNSEECTCVDDNTNDKSIAATLGLTGDISDCCCTFDTLEDTNLNHVYPLLKRVVATPFFAHFKIDLCSSCELWNDSPMCVLRDCGVCECEAPPDWASEAEWIPKEVIDDDCGHVDDKIITSVDAHVSESWMTTPADTLFFDGESSILDNSEVVDEDRAVVVDLRLNPERYTGYRGQSTDKVWRVHEDNCFQQNDDYDNENEQTSTPGYCTLETEQRIYNKIISGMHSSINLHIAHSYCLEMDKNHIEECKTWGANSTLAYDRVLSHKDRLENLHVVFAVLLRAVQKAGSTITSAVPANDPFFAESLSEWTNNLQPEITKMVESCPLMFDESSLFSEVTSGGDIEAKRLELKRRFKHLLDIMQCVGCDRCKLWGTLQTLGIGTALRVILDEEWDTQSATKLSRQESVALVHTLERFSSALVYTHDLAVK